MSKREHRRFTAEQKLAILREADQPGVSVSERLAMLELPPLDRTGSRIPTAPDNGTTQPLSIAG